MSMCKHGEIGYCEFCDGPLEDDDDGRLFYCSCPCRCVAMVDRPDERCPMCAEGCGPVDGGDWR